MSDRPSGPKSREEERAGADPIDPDAPPSAEEIAASERLRDALRGPPAAAAGGDDLDLVQSLRAAWSPGALDGAEHAQILDDMPASAEELALAAELRAALEGGELERTAAASRSSGATDRAADRQLVEALQAAFRPAALPDDEHAEIVRRALAARGATDGGAKVIAFPARARTTRLAVVSATAVLALAASVALWVTTAPPDAEAPLARARSTQPLFGEPFKAGETSARIDRIAAARASDYRDNRFAKWGVR